MWRRQVFIGAIGILLLGAPARAEDEFLASLRLRGGYDSNVQFSSGHNPVGSAFIATDAALAAGAKDGDSSWAITADGSTTRYANQLLVSATTGKVLLRGSMGDDELRISSVSSIVDISTYNLRATDILQVFKVESLQDKVRLFVSAEGGRSTINQTNAIFQDFSPQPLQYWRGAIIPGVSVIRGKAELGVSLNVSARRYTDELDIFGYRRDNERVQPFLFGKYDGDELTGFASISQLYARFHDVDFTNVDRTLFEANVGWRPKAVKQLSVDLGAQRRAGETSFPISPITIDTLYTAKAGWQVDPKLLLTALVGYAATEYLDSPFRQQITTVGVGLSREITSDVRWGMDLSRTTGTLINGDKASAIIVASSLTKTFSPNGARPALDGKTKQIK
ncbi:outer membrane beta-barrel protein [Tardiphaga sp.]|uniref:outer membrane beta-barrel protein n=1 Tax=Tardiphaga sp. TaxID=1926292 RepID=UPI0025D48295|nr:outer membrane beta-barrel protein [Tardiphaga sp.]